ncbi:hypothetical protein GIX45_24630 [Erwinia sp. CPCC 100877]|nr:hypothetical protein [Erwinia sp. CPCC 100877]
MKQILGILSVIIVFGAVIYVIFGNPLSDNKTQTSTETTETVTTNTQPSSTTTNEPAQTSKTTITSAVD